MYNILVTGGNGQLGMAFKSLFCDDLNYHLILLILISLILQIMIE